VPVHKSKTVSSLLMLSNSTINCTICGGVRTIPKLLLSVFPYLINSL
jgi:hypothetical protein